MDWMLRRLLYAAEFEMSLYLHLPHSLSTLEAQTPGISRFPGTMQLRNVVRFSRHVCILSQSPTPTTDKGLKAVK